LEDKGNEITSAGNYYYRNSCKYLNINNINIRLG